MGTDFLSVIFDPLDIYGTRGKKAQEEAEDKAKEGEEKTMAFVEDRTKKAEKLYDQDLTLDKMALFSLEKNLFGYVDKGLMNKIYRKEIGWSPATAVEAAKWKRSGGKKGKDPIPPKAPTGYDEKFDFKLSPTFEFRRQEAERAGLQGLAKLGLSGSGKAAEHLSNIDNRLLAEEEQNYFDKLKIPLQLGSGAKAALGSIYSGTAINPPSIMGQVGLTNAANSIRTAENQQTAITDLLSSITSMIGFGSGGGFSGGPKTQV